MQKKLDASAKMSSMLCMSVCVLQIVTAAVQSVSLLVYVVLVQRAALAEKSTPNAAQKKTNNNSDESKQR